MRYSLFSSKGQNAYIKAKAKMRSVYKRINSNIPDYNPFDLPTNAIFVKYPSESLITGSVHQRNLVNKNDLRIDELNYKDKARLKVHTHYGFYEYVYIKQGVFIDIDNVAYIPGDGIILDGYNRHSLRCASSTGTLLLAFSSKKEKLNVKLLYKFLTK